MNYVMLEDFFGKPIIITGYNRENIYFTYEGKKYVSWEGQVTEVKEAVAYED